MKTYLDQKIAEAEARNKRLKAALAQQRHTNASNPDLLFTQDSPSSSLRGFEAIGHPAMMSTPCKRNAGGREHDSASSSQEMFFTPTHGDDDGNMSSTTGGFLELKTPAAWNAHRRQHGGSQEFLDHRSRHPSKKTAENNVPRQGQGPFNDFTRQLPHHRDHRSRSSGWDIINKSTKRPKPHKIRKFFSP